VATLFCLRAKFENYFSLQATLFKIVSYDKVTTSAELKKWVFLKLLLSVFDQISGSRRSMLLFLLQEKGPRAAKISWRATLWPCLYYYIRFANYSVIFKIKIYFKCKAIMGGNFVLAFESS